VIISSKFDHAGRTVIKLATVMKTNANKFRLGVEVCWM